MHVFEKVRGKPTLLICNCLRIPSPGQYNTISRPRSVHVCVLRVNMCDYVLQVPCSHFGDESEQPNEYFGLKIFFSLLLLLLMSSAILSDLNTLEALMMNTFFVLRMPL